MKKTLKIMAIISVVIIVIVIIAGIYKFNYLSGQPGYDVDGNKITESSSGSMHPSWDLDKDGINDCEKENLCDDSVDYSQPRVSAE